MADINSFTYSITPPQDAASPVVLSLELEFSSAFNQNANPRVWVYAYDPGAGSYASGFWVYLTYDESKDKFVAEKNLLSTSSSGIYQCGWVYSTNTLGNEIAYNNTYLQEQGFETIVNLREPLLIEI